MGTYRRGDELWSIEREDKRLTIVEGRVTRVEDMPSAALARTRFTVLTNQKARDGWRLVVDEAPTEPAPKNAVVYHVRDPHLEAVILEDPDNDEAWFVYGDWLMQQGDPRGTQIALRRASRAAPDDHIARERLRRFEAQHYSYLIGGTGGVLGWGFLDEVSVESRAACERVLRADAARFLRRIEVLYAATRHRDKIFALLEAKAPSTLRELDIDHIDEVATFGAMPRLLARLRVLELRGGVSRRAIDGLAGAKELFTLGIGRDVDVVQLAKSPVAGRLQHLYLGGIGERDAADLADRIERFPALRSIALPPDVEGEGARRLEYAVGIREDLPGRYRTINE